MRLEVARVTQHCAEFHGVGQEIFRRLPLGVHQGTLRIAATGEVVWSGVWEKREGDSGLHMRLASTRSNGEAVLVAWSDLPRIFSVLDGGYSPLEKAQLATVIDDALTFRDQAHCTVYFQNDGRNYSSKASLEEADHLVDLSEILVKTTPLIPQNSVSSPAVILIELFEVTYLLVVFLEDIHGDEVVLSLTNHSYVSARRNGRRWTVESGQSIDGLEIVEISDFGLRVLGSKGARDSLNDIISVRLDDTCQAHFRIAWRTDLGENIEEMGLYLAEDSQLVRKSWQQLVQRLIYPSLRWRTHEDHDRLLNLYQETGYAGSYSKRGSILDFADSIRTEWSWVDSIGPDTGVTVIGSAGGKAVGSIGVSRLTSRAWAAQAAAMIDDPAYLPVTRELYSWRTRAILMQPDGDYHVAVFDRDKRFLDRFFRKFFLEHGGASTADLSWNEWASGTRWLNPAKTSETGHVQGLSHPPLEPLHALLASDTSGTCKIETFGNATVVRSRPFLHISQIFTSAWFPAESVPSEYDDALATFTAPTPFFTVWTKNSAQILDKMKGDSLVEMHGWNVVWICSRRLLPQFLSNSLKSLEIMTRKYGSKPVA